MTLVMIVVLTALIVPWAATVLKRARCGAASLRDAMNMKQVHQGILLYASSNKYQYPTPGLIKPLQNADGSTSQDFSLNHSSPLYSYLIGAHYVQPELLVTSLECLEVNRGVRIKKDYDFAAYNPAAGTFWDPSFVMRIDDPGIGANSSFAHMAICGDRRETKWRETGNSGDPILGTRGPRDGAQSGDEYTRSPTLRLHDPLGSWDGNVVFADNHTERLNSMYSSLTFIHSSDGTVVKDNIYAAEFDHPKGPQAAADAFLGIFIAAGEFDVQPVFDPLD